MQHKDVPYKHDRPIYNGCAYHDDCFSCPYDDCIMGQNHMQQENTESPKAIALQMLLSGRQTCDVVRETGLSKMTVCRYRKQLA